MRTGDLADIVGVQLAWWQLGFRGRRAVRRRAGHGGAGAGDEVGRAWALQVLLAPWWWRAARTAVAAGAALLVVVVADIGLLPEINDATVAVLVTVLLSVGVTAGLTWRQTQWAREIAGPAGEHARPQSVRLRQLQLAVAVVLAVAALTVFLQSAADTVSSDIGCHEYEPMDPHLAPGPVGSGGVGRCYAGPSVTRKDGVAWVPEANGHYVYWIPKLGGVVGLSGTMRAAWLANPWLGLPTDLDRPDCGGRYVNLEHGYLLEAPNQPLAIVPGRSHQPEVGGAACHPIADDRPRMTEADLDGLGGIQVAWTYPHADAYNVTYWIVGRPDRYETEAAGPRFTIPDPVPGVTYGFQVQACQKHFLGRSTCTPGSDSVAVSTGR